MNEKPIPQNQRTPLETVLPLASPYVIFLDPSGACNFRCVFCPCNIDGFQANERHKIMSWDLFVKIAADLEAFSPRTAVIYLHGFGEPLLNPRICDMARYIKEHNLCRELRITTNASLLTEEMSEGLVNSGIDLIRISVEALTAEGYESLCGYRLDMGKFMDQLGYLYQYSRGKCRIAAKIVNACIHSKADEKRFYEMFSPVSDYHYIEEVQEFWPEFEEIELPEDAVEARKLYHDAMSETTVCAAPMTEMTVYANGRVGVCAADWKFDLCYGDVRTKTLKELWNSKALRDFQLEHLKKKRSEIKFCGGCKYRSQDYIDDAADKIIKRLEEAAVSQ